MRGNLTVQHPGARLPLYTLNDDFFTTGKQPGHSDHQSRLQPPAEQQNQRHLLGHCGKEW